MKVEKLDNANAKVEAKIQKSEIDKHLDKIAKEAAKTVSISGFRKGKVPVKVVKKMYSDKLNQDAESEAFREIYQECLNELNIKQEDLIGEPLFVKYDKDEEGNIDIELKLFIKPNIDLGDYKSLIPEINIPEVSDDEIEEELKNYAKQHSETIKVEEDRELKEGDIAVIDFKGFIDDEAFEGGEAKDYPLEIGSKSFIDNFEEQLIGMKVGDEKDIVVTFPKDYQADNLAGKEAKFEVKLNEIKEKKEANIDDELAKKILNKEDATIDELKNQIKENLQNRKKQDYYMNELKDKFLEKLIDTIECDLPQNIVDKEVDNLLNQKAQTMEKEELEKLQNDKEAVIAMAKELEPDAKKSVKLTFVIDELAKKEEVSVSDEEVNQVLYYEAIMSGQQPAETIKRYEEAGYLPVIKMSMVENKLLTKLFDEANK